MKIESLTLGTYQVCKAYYEVHNGRSVPIADVCFKADNSIEWDWTLRKIRLQSLYNPSSIGPKDLFPKESIKSLELCLLGVQNLITRKSPDDITKTLYIAEWDVKKPDNYEDLKSIESDLEGDILLQNTGNCEELNAIAMDLLIYDLSALKEEANQTLVIDVKAIEDEDQF